MLELTNIERKQLKSAIIAAYPTPDDLEEFLEDYLNESLVEVTGAGIPFKTIVHRLVRWAIAKRKIERLILALEEDTENPQIQLICAKVLQLRIGLNERTQSDLDISLDLDPSSWNLDESNEQLEFFLPQQFSFEADVGALRKGLNLANSVCKITFTNRPSEYCGTGVLIAPDLVLTNYHVLSRQDEDDLDAIGRYARCEFGLVSDGSSEVMPYACLQAASENSVVSSSPIQQLDYALIRVTREDSCDIQPVPFGTYALEPKSTLHILQHPNGEAMKISLSDNGIVKINENRGLVLYVNATEKGSSGSPCFDEEWNLVAIHHKKKITNFGSVQEGILFSAIYSDIKSFL